MKWIKLSRKLKFKVGDKVRVGEGGGCAAGKTGVVVNRNEIQLGWGGVPSNVSGEYKPPDWTVKVPIKYEDGEYDLIASWNLRYRHPVETATDEEIVEMFRETK